MKILFALTLSLLTAQAFAQGTLSSTDKSAPAAVYYCVPMFAWDTGYNVAINYDEIKNQFRAKIYAVDFFGEKAIINEPVQMQLGQGDSGRCVFSFSQLKRSPGHSVSFRDLDHHEFAMELSLAGQKVDPNNKHLRCQVAPWFVEQTKACN